MIKKNILLFFLLWIQTASGFVVLIDPGHGGKELGAVGVFKKKNSKGKIYDHKVYEKDLTLKVALYLKKELQKSFSTYLTRSFDRTVSLEERAELAETVKADVFISIHFNSSEEHNSHGFETYYLDNHQDKAIKKVEAIENTGLEGENKIINQILIDLAIQKTVPNSKKLANAIHVAIGKKIQKFKMRDRGIKPGLFYVLALSKRPGVLLEGGFMSQPDELKKIHKISFLKKYALSIAKGIKEFQKTLPEKSLPLF